jgi:hypothetical protein
MASQKNEAYKEKERACRLQKEYLLSGLQLKGQNSKNHSDNADYLTPNLTWHKILSVFSSLF